MTKTLNNILGQKLTAYILGSKATIESVDSLNKVVAILMAEEDVGTIRNWLTGMNPMLSDRSPASVLREGTEDGTNQVIQAAKNFVE